MNKKTTLDDIEKQAERAIFLSRLERATEKRLCIYNF